MSVYDRDIFRLTFNLKDIKIIHYIDDKIREFNMFLNKYNVRAEQNHIDKESTYTELIIKSEENKKFQYLMLKDIKEYLKCQEIFYNIRVIFSKSVQMNFFIKKFYDSSMIGNGSLDIDNLFNDYLIPMNPEFQNCNKNISFISCGSQINDINEIKTLTNQIIKFIGYLKKLFHEDDKKDEIIQNSLTFNSYLVRHNFNIEINDNTYDLIFKFFEHNYGAFLFNLQFN